MADDIEMPATASATSSRTISASSSRMVSASSSRTISTRSESTESIPAIQGDYDCALKLAALVYLRVKKRKNLRFILNVDVKETRLTNVLFLRLLWTYGGNDRWITYLVALAHIKNNESERNDSLVRERSHEDVLAQDEQSSSESENKEPVDVRTYWQIFKSTLEEMHLIDLDEETGESITHPKRNDGSRFIIYTTDNVTRNTKPEDSTKIDFPFRDLFSTGKPEDVVAFNDKCHPQKERDRETNLYYKFFLPRLRIFTKQRGPTDLNALIRQALTSAVQYSVPKIGDFLLAYLEWMEEWRMENAYCLTDTSIVLEKALTKKMMEDDSVLDVKFHDSQYETIIRRLNMRDILYITIPDVSKQLRCCKVTWVLQHMYKNNFFVLTERILSNFPISTLSVLCDKACEAIVINSDLTEESVQLINSILTERLKKIIVISTNYLEPLRQALLCLERTYKEWSETWTLNELEDSVQDDLMDNTVSFQGRLVSLRDLEALWPSIRSEINGPMLNTLISGQVVTLGDVPSPYVPCDPHIPRLLCHRSALKQDVFQLDTDRDIIMVTGVPKKLLRDLFNTSTQTDQGDQSEAHCTNESLLLNSSSVSENKSQSRFESFGDCESKAAVAASGGVDIGYSRRYTGDLTHINPSPEETNRKVFIFSYAETAALDAFKRDLANYTALSIHHSGKSVHWVSYEHGVLIWKNTFGSDEKIIQYLDKMGQDCQNSPICSHNDFYYTYKTWASKVMTVVGGSGMGKTMLLKKISHSLLEELKSYWIINISLPRNRYVLETTFANGKISMSQAIDFLDAVVKGENSTSPTFCRSFLKYSVEQAGNCVILFDGLDELEDVIKQIALRVIKKLSETNVGQIWVGMTGRDELDLQESLRCPRLELQPVEHEEQAEYLSLRWTMENDVPSGAEMYDPVADTLSEFTPLYDGVPIFSVPLFLFLFAGAHVPPRHAHHLMEYAQRMGREVPRMTVFGLYRDYVERFERGERRRLEAAAPPPASAPRAKKSKRRKGAARAASPAVPEAPKDDITAPALLEKAQRLAAHVTRGEPELVHRSFSEFYVAAWLREQDAALGLDYLRRSALPPDEPYGVRSQLDWFVADGRLLHQAAVTGDDVDADDEAWRGGRLHARDRFGRQPLHLAVAYGREGLVQQLLQAGAAIDVEDEVLQWTPLDYADASCNLTIMEMLLDYGGDPNRLKTLRERSEEEKLDLMLKRAFATHKMKAECDSLSVVFVVPASTIAPEKLGLTEDLINNKDGCFNEGAVLCPLELQRPYMFAFPQIAYKGYTHLAKFLLENHSADDPCLYSVSAMHTAAYYGHDNLLKLLLDHGMECNKRKHDGRTPLHVACQGYHTKTLNVLLESGADVNAPDNFWMTPAMVAAVHGSVQVLRELIKHGIHLESADQRGRTALYHAVEQNHLEAVKALLEAGANVYAADKFEITPMQMAIAKGNSDIVLEIYQHVESTDQRDLFGATPLHHLCAYQQLDLFVKLLVRKHAVNVSDHDGVTPLHIAAKLGCIKFVDILLKRGADCKAEDRNGLNALHYATMGGNADLVERLVKMGIEDLLGETKYEKCLLLAAMVGKVEAMKTLLKNGAVIDTENPRHCALLHYANVSKNDEMIRLLLDVGIDPNVQEPSANNVPLHIAVKGGVLKIVEMLLEKGANPNLTSEDGRSPLHLAASSGHVPIAEALLRHDADPNLVDKTNVTPVILAARFKNTGVLKVLVEAGGKTEVLEGNRWSVLHVAVIEDDMDTTEYLLSTGMDVDLRDSRGFTPLLLACEGNARFEFIKFLIDRGADATAIDNQYKRTALHNSAYRGKRDAVALLLELGLDVDVVDEWDSTPLHVAAWMGHTKCVRFLVNKGANVNACNVFGQSPLHKAFEWKRKNTALALMQLGADPRYVKFSELDMWEGFVERADYVRNSIKLLGVPKQTSRRSPIKRVSASTPRRKKLQYITTSKMSKTVKKFMEDKVARKLNANEALEETLCPCKLDLVPPEEVDIYFPPEEELKDVSSHLSSLGKPPQQQLTSGSTEITSETIHPPGEPEKTPKKPQECQQQEPSERTSRPGPSKNIPRQMHSKNIPKQVECSKVPQKVQSKNVPKQVESSKVPQKVQSKNVPKQVESSKVPQKVQSKNVPKQVESSKAPQKVQSKNVPKQVESRNDPPKVQSKNVPNEMESSKVAQMVQSKNFPKQVESCNIHQKMQPRLVQSAMLDNINRKKSKKERNKDVSPSQTPETVKLTEKSDEVPSKDESSKRQRHRRRQ